MMKESLRACEARLRYILETGMLSGATIEFQEATAEIVKNATDALELEIKKNTDLRDGKLEQAVLETVTELRSAGEEFGAFASAHEAYGVIIEELRELEEHVFMNQKRRDVPAMRKEACQLAAMAVRLMVDLC